MSESTGSIRRNPLYVATRTTGRLQTLTSKLARAELVALTQVEVHKPSDAAGRWGALHGLAAGRADQGIWKGNLGSAQDRLDVAESALGEASNLIRGAWERAIQLSSESYSPEERASAASEIEGIRSSLLQLANTRVGERSIFAGDATDGEAFDSAGLYVGAAATGRVQIGTSDSIESTIDGSEIFQGTTDVFAALSSLSSALSSGDTAAISASVDAMAAAHGQVVSARQGIGYQQQRVSDALGVTVELEALLEERLSSAVGADPAASYSEFVSLKTSYESALQVVAASSGSKLFDFLR